LIGHEPLIRIDFDLSDFAVLFSSLLDIRSLKGYVECDFGERESEVPGFTFEGAPTR